MEKGRVKREDMREERGRVTGEEEMNQRGQGKRRGWDGMG